MTNKELKLIGQLTEVAMTVAELRAENKILKDINEKLMQALLINDVSGSLPLADLEKRLDEALDKETPETLNKWLEEKRK